MFLLRYRSSICFDRVFNLLNNTQRLNAVDTWPAFDVVKTGEDDYRITMAVAGFGEGDLDITQERNVLVIKGGKAEELQGEYPTAALLVVRSSGSSSLLITSG